MASELFWDVFPGSELRLKWQMERFFDFVSAEHITDDIKRRFGLEQGDTGWRITISTAVAHHRFSDFYHSLPSTERMRFYWEFFKTRAFAIANVLSALEALESVPCDDEKKQLQKLLDVGNKHFSKLVEGA